MEQPNTTANFLVSVEVLLLVAFLKECFMDAVFQNTVHL